MTRQKANKEILPLLEELIDLFPDQRFGQILANYVFPMYQERDMFYEESTETLRHLKELKDAEPGQDNELPSVR